MAALDLSTVEFNNLNSNVITDVIITKDNNKERKPSKKAAMRSRNVLNISSRYKTGLIIFSYCTYQFIFI
jgi:hypothetical protein